MIPLACFALFASAQDDTVLTPEESLAPLDAGVDLQTALDMQVLFKQFFSLFLKI